MPREAKAKKRTAEEIDAELLPLESQWLQDRSSQRFQLSLLQVDLKNAQIDNQLCQKESWKEDGRVRMAESHKTQRRNQYLEKLSALRELRKGIVERCKNGHETVEKLAWRLHQVESSHMEMAKTTKQLESLATGQPMNSSRGKTQEKVPAANGGHAADMMVVNKKEEKVGKKVGEEHMINDDDHTTARYHEHLHQQTQGLKNVIHQLERKYNLPLKQRTSNRLLRLTSTSQQQTNETTKKKNENGEGEKEKEKKGGSASYISFPPKVVLHPSADASTIAENTSSSRVTLHFQQQQKKNIDSGPHGDAQSARNVVDGNTTTSSLALQFLNENGDDEGGPFSSVLDHRPGHTRCDENSGRLARVYQRVQTAACEEYSRPQNFSLRKKYHEVRGEGNNKMTSSMMTTRDSSSSMMNEGRANRMEVLLLGSDGPIHHLNAGEMKCSHLNAGEMKCSHHHHHHNITKEEYSFSQINKNHNEDFNIFASDWNHPFPENIWDVCSLGGLSTFGQERSFPFLRFLLREVCACYCITSLVPDRSASLDSYCALKTPAGFLQLVVDSLRRLAQGTPSDGAAIPLCSLPSSTPSIFSSGDDDKTATKGPHATNSSVHSSASSQCIRGAVIQCATSSQTPGANGQEMLSIPFRYLFPSATSSSSSTSATSSVDILLSQVYSILISQAKCPNTFLLIDAWSKDHLTNKSQREGEDAQQLFTAAETVVDVEKKSTGRKEEKEVMVDEKRYGFCLFASPLCPEPLVFEYVKPILTRNSFDDKGDDGHDDDDDDDEGATTGKPQQRRQTRSTNNHVNPTEVPSTGFMLEEFIKIIAESTSTSESSPLNVHSVYDRLETRLNTFSLELDRVLHEEKEVLKKMRSRGCSEQELKLEQRPHHQGEENDRLFLRRLRPTDTRLWCMFVGGIIAPNVTIPTILRLEPSTIASHSLPHQCVSEWNKENKKYQEAMWERQHRMQRRNRILRQKKKEGWGMEEQKESFFEVSKTLNEDEDNEKMLQQPVFPLHYKLMALHNVIRHLVVPKEEEENTRQGMSGVVKNWCLAEPQQLEAGIVAKAPQLQKTNVEADDSALARLSTTKKNKNAANDDDVSGVNVSGGKMLQRMGGGYAYNCYVPKKHQRTSHHETANRATMCEATTAPVEVESIPTTSSLRCRLTVLREIKKSTKNVSIRKKNENFREEGKTATAVDVVDNNYIDQEEALFSTSETFTLITENNGNNGNHHLEIIKPKSSATDESSSDKAENTKENGKHTTTSENNVAKEGKMTPPQETAVDASDAKIKEEEEEEKEKEKGAAGKPPMFIYAKYVPKSNDDKPYQPPSLIEQQNQMCPQQLSRRLSTLLQRKFHMEQLQENRRQKRREAEVSEQRQLHYDPKKEEEDHQKEEGNDGNSSLSIIEGGSGSGSVVVGPEIQVHMEACQSVGNLSTTTLPNNSYSLDPQLEHLTMNQNTEGGIKGGAFYCREIDVTQLSQQKIKDNSTYNRAENKDSTTTSYMVTKTRNFSFFYAFSVVLHLGTTTTKQTITTKTKDLASSHHQEDPTASSCAAREYLLRSLLQLPDIQKCQICNQYNTTVPTMRRCQHPQGKEEGGKGEEVETTITEKVNHAFICEMDLKMDVTEYFASVVHSSSSSPLDTAASSLSLLERLSKLMTVSEKTTADHQVGQGGCRSENPHRFALPSHIETQVSMHCLTKLQEKLLENILVESPEGMKKVSEDVAELQRQKKEGEQDKKAEKEQKEVAGGDDDANIDEQKILAIQILQNSAREKVARRVVGEKLNKNGKEENKNAGEKMKQQDDPKTVAAVTEKDVVSPTINYHVVINSIFLRESYDIRIDATVNTTTTTTTTSSSLSKNTINATNNINNKKYLAAAPPVFSPEKLLFWLRSHILTHHGQLTPTAESTPRQEEEEGRERNKKISFLLENNFILINVHSLFPLPSSTPSPLLSRLHQTEPIRWNDLSTQQMTKLLKISSPPNRGEQEVKDTKRTAAHPPRFLSTTEQQKELEEVELETLKKMLSIGKQIDVRENWWPIHSEVIETASSSLLTTTSTALLDNFQKTENNRAILSFILPPIPSHHQTKTVTTSTQLLFSQEENGIFSFSSKNSFNLLHLPETHSWRSEFYKSMQVFTKLYARRYVTTCYYESHPVDESLQEFYAYIKKNNNQQQKEDAEKEVMQFVQQLMSVGRRRERKKTQEEENNKGGGNGKNVVALDDILYDAFYASPPRLLPKSFLDYLLQSNTNVAFFKDKMHPMMVKGRSSSGFVKNNNDDDSTPSNISSMMMKNQPQQEEEEEEEQKNSIFPPIVAIRLAEANFPLHKLFAVDDDKGKKQIVDVKKDENKQTRESKEEEEEEETAVNDRKEKTEDLYGSKRKKSNEKEDQHRVGHEVFYFPSSVLSPEKVLSRGEAEQEVKLQQKNEVDMGAEEWKVNVSLTRWTVGSPGKSRMPKYDLDTVEYSNTVQDLDYFVQRVARLPH